MSDTCAGATALNDTALSARTMQRTAFRRAEHLLSDEDGRAIEPLLITMEDLQHALGCGKTMAFAIVGSGQIESVMVGRKRMPVYESVKAYVQRLRDANPTLKAA